MAIHLGFGQVSGFSLEDAHFIGARWDPAVEGADQIITRASVDEYRSLISIQSCTDLWRSPSGAVYAAAGPRIVWTVGEQDEQWESFDCPIVAGVWGLDDQHVFALPRGLCTNYYFRFDGHAWTRRESPGVFHRMHGLRSDALVAVGSPGLIARWDGERWHARHVEGRGTFLDVHVASDDEMYAVRDSGQLWQGDGEGWSLRIQTTPHTLNCVAKWRDRVWVGTSDRGLCVLEGDRLVAIKPNVRPRTMDARRDLLMSQSAMIVGTADGESFRAIKLESLKILFAPIEPRWLDSSASR